MSYVANDCLAAGMDVDMFDDDLLPPAASGVREHLYLARERPLQARQRQGGRILLRYRCAFAGVEAGAKRKSQPVPNGYL